jgi:hypothetical protein
VTAFRSPTTASAFTEPIPGSTFLACHFAPCTAAHKLVRLSAPLPIAVRPASGRLLASARRLLAATLDLPLLRPPLPFRILTSLRIKAFSRIRCRSVRLPITPDLLLLPAPVFLLLVGGSGSKLQVRYVSATAPRSAVGFFRSGCLSGCPARLITQSTSGQHSA